MPDPSSCLFAADRGPTPAERLRGDAARIAGRLAALLQELSGPGGEGAGDALGFLCAMAEIDSPVAGRADREGVLERRWASPPPHPFDRLAAALDLSPVESDVIVLAGLPEEHEGYGRVLRTLHPRGEPRPTVGLAAQLFCTNGAERAAFRERLVSGPAVRSGVLVLGSDGPFFERSLQIADPLWAVMCGVDAWPSALRPLPVEAATAGLDDWLAAEPARRARHALRLAEPRLILVIADTEDIALGRGVALAAAAGAPAAAFALPAGAGEDLERQLVLQAVLRDIVPIVRLVTADGPGAGEVPELGGLRRPAIVCARHGVGVARVGHPLLGVPVDGLRASARRHVWTGALPELRADAPLLAARYSVEPAAACDVARDVRSLAALDGGAIDVRQVSDSVRLRSNLSLSAGVKLLHPIASWNDLVLPPDTLAQLHEAVGRLMNQARVLDQWGFLAGRPGGRGVRLLFSGPPGTGKTLSAEVLATAIGVDLLMVDISRVVSKWIGETEKHLAEVFDAAERAQAVLLFDEADALFGRRTEVSDAHDRYANLETAYLLSRLERFDGMAVLATNLRQNIDPAFLRRLEFLVEFQEPDARERERLWRAHLPAAAPLGADVDLRELARLYPVVGALIRNAAVAAGFLAADADGGITQGHLVRALRREYQKAGRAFPGAHRGIAAAPGV